MQTIIRPIFLFGLITLSVSLAAAQTCGYNFSRFDILNSANETISSPTIEILAMVPAKDNKDLWKYGDKDYKRGANYFKISDRFVKKVLGLSEPLEITKDTCGNSLKQTINIKRVKQPIDDIKNRKKSSTNLGFCTTETILIPYVLKISAPGYVTGYYIGTFLGGCYWHVEFVLTKSEES